MIAAYSSSAVYVGPFARSWPGLSITDLDHMQNVLLRLCCLWIIRQGAGLLQEAINSLTIARYAVENIPLNIV